MALTKVTKTGITDNAIDGDKIEDGTVVAADIAPGTISSDKIATGTIANDKLANSSVTINNSAVSLGGSLELSTGADWQAVTVADGSTTLNAEAGKGYFLDTNAGVIEVFLPSSPARGDKVILADYSGTFATNQIIINTGGELLDSTAGNDFKVTTNNSIVELIYVDSAKGWLVKLNQAAGTTPGSVNNLTGTYDGNLPAFTEATGGTITTSGDFKIHTFTGDGCFVVSSVGNLPLFSPCQPGAGPNTVDYLVVAGGGAGRFGGAGAGGFREAKTGDNGCHTASPLATPTGLSISTTTYPITVGGGGASENNACGATPAIKGSDSVFSTITSTGGGGGLGGAPATEPFQSGGSGGGGSIRSDGNYNGSGNTPPVSPPQGTDGGASENFVGGNPCGGGAAGGGGGATVAGQAGACQVGGVGGTGATTSISGSPVVYAGGGGAGGRQPGGTSANGGSGGGGNGNRTGNGQPGGTNQGGGGGGGGFTTSPQVYYAGGAGGKGIVIIRYKYQ